MAPTIVGVSGSPTTPSRTSVLVRAVADGIADRMNGTSHHIELAPLLSDLGRGPTRRDVGERVLEALELVESADVLVVGSPAYRATYTGLFKLFFDHVGQYSLQDVPVVLTATGGSDRHALLVDHQMRPLFGFFQALTVPLGIYANQDDFAGQQIASPQLVDRIETTLERIVPVIHSRLLPVGAAAGGDFARPHPF